MNLSDIGNLSNKSPDYCGIIAKMMEIILVSSDTSLGVINSDSALKNYENYYPLVFLRV